MISEVGIDSTSDTDTDNDVFSGMPPAIVSGPEPKEPSVTSKFVSCKVEQSRSVMMLLRQLSYVIRISGPWTERSYYLCN